MTGQENTDMEKQSILLRSEVQVKVPIIRLAREDSVNLAARVLHGINRHNYWGDNVLRSRQGRKQGLGRNRAKRRGQKKEDKP